MIKHFLEIIFVFVVFLGEKRNLRTCSIVQMLNVCRNTVHKVDITLQITSHIKKLVIKNDYAIKYCVILLITQRSLTFYEKEFKIR